MFEWSIPSFTTVASLTIPLTVKPTETSLVIEFAVALSPSINVPIGLASLSSYIDCPPCTTVTADSTVALAPEVTPVMS